MKKIFFVMLLCFILLCTSNAMAVISDDTEAYHKSETLIYVDCATGEITTQNWSSIDYDEMNRISSACFPGMLESIDGFLSGGAQSGKVDLNGVIGDDERTLVADTTLFPYRAVCYITSDIGFAGSGALIGRYRVLTCAHLFYNRNTQACATSGTVFPGYDAGVINSSPYGAISIKRIIFCQDYVTCTDAESGDNDWCILKLESPIGDQTGWLGVKTTSDSLIGSSVYVSGYPGDLVSIYKVRQWLSRGSVLSWTDKGFRYDCDTESGSSGSPVYDSTTSIVGIHCNSFSSNGVPVSNGGPRITSSLYDKVMYTVMSCEYDVDEDGKYILGIAPSTTCLTVKTNMSGGSFAVKNHNGATIENGALVGTGMTLCHSVGSSPSATYATVIYGDVDGDGLITVSDVTELRSLIVAGNASGAYLKAGDLDGDGRLSSSDVVELRALITAG